MSEKRAYELAAAYASDDESKAFSGGSVALGPDGRSFDVGKALEDGSGTIVTEDPAIITALDSYPALKRVATSGAEGVEPVGEAPNPPAGTPAKGSTRKAGGK